MFLVLRFMVLTSGRSYFWRLLSLITEFESELLDLASSPLALIHLKVINFDHPN